MEKAEAMENAGADIQRSFRKRLVGEQLTCNAINFPNRTALHDTETGKTTTFKSLEKRVNAVANGLRDKHGVRPGDRVALYGRNHIDSLVSYFALGRIGAVSVPLNYRANREELSHILSDCAPVAILVA